jgi:hypothetical protein
MEHPTLYQTVCSEQILKDSPYSLTAVVSCHSVCSGVRGIMLRIVRRSYSKRARGL